jgi:hypothetical protein
MRYPKFVSKQFFLPYFVFADAKSTTSLFNTDKSDLPSSRCLFIFYKSGNYTGELERGRYVNSPCASPAHQLPLLIHHSHTHIPLIYHVLSPSIFSRGKTGLSKSVVQPESSNNGSSVTSYTRTHTFNANSTTKALHTTRTRTQALILAKLSTLKWLGPAVT